MAKDYYTLKDAVQFLTENSGDKYTLQDLIPLAAKNSITPCFYYSGYLSEDSLTDSPCEAFNGYLTPSNTDYVRSLDQHSASVKVSGVKIVEDCLNKSDVFSDSKNYIFCIEMEQEIGSSLVFRPDSRLEKTYRNNQLYITASELQAIVSSNSNRSKTDSNESSVNYELGLTGLNLSLNQLQTQIENLQTQQAVIEIRSINELLLENHWISFYDTFELFSLIQCSSSKKHKFADLFKSQIEEYLSSLKIISKYDPFHGIVENEPKKKVLEYLFNPEIEEPWEESYWKNYGLSKNDAFAIIYDDKSLTTSLANFSITDQDTLIEKIDEDCPNLTYISINLENGIGEYEYDLHTKIQLKSEKYEENIVASNPKNEEKFVKEINSLKNEIYLLKQKLENVTIYECCDPEHEHYAPELHSVIKLWHFLYIEGGRNPNDSHTNDVNKWLTKNMEEPVTNLLRARFKTITTPKKLKDKKLGK